MSEVRMVEQRSEVLGPIPGGLADKAQTVAIAGMSKTITVSTKEELARAYENRYPEIVVLGELAHQLRKARRVNKLGKAAVASIAAAAAGGALFAGPTAGASAVGGAGVAVAIAAASGVSVPAIIIASSIGISMVVAVLKDYEVDFGLDPLHMRLKPGRK